MTTITLLGKDADGLFGPYGLSAPWIDGLAHNNGEHGRHERAHPIGFVGRLGISIPGYAGTQRCAQLILENLCASSRSEWLWMEGVSSKQAQPYMGVVESEAVGVSTLAVDLNL
jgi:hypothetical protein